MMPARIEFGRLEHYLKSAALIGLAAGLGTLLLGRESFWLDETLSAAWARLDLADLLRTTAADVHPPLYYLWLWGWVRVAGPSEFAVRLLSVFSGVLAAAFTLTAGARLLGPAAARLAALLMALSPVYVYYAQEARNYALLLMLTAASFACLVRLECAGRRWPLALAVANTLLLYTHIAGVFVLAGQAVYAVFGLRSRGARRRWTLAQLAAGLFFLPWAWTLVRQVTAVQASYWITRPAWLTVLAFVIQFSGSFLAFYFALSALALAAYAAWRRRPARPRASASAVWLLMTWLGAPIVIPWLISQWSTPIYLTRLSIGALPAYALLLAWALRRLPMPLRPLLAGAVLLSQFTSLPPLYRDLTKTQWRAAVPQLAQAAQPGDWVLLYPGYNANALQYYAPRPAPWTLKLLESVDDAEALDLAAGPPRLWLIVVQAPADSAAFQARLVPAYRLADMATYTGLQVILYERSP